MKIHPYIRARCVAFHLEIQKRHKQKALSFRNFLAIETVVHE